LHAWPNELRYGLKPYSSLAFWYHVVHLFRKAAFIAVLLMPSSYSLLKLNLSTTMSGLMLVYLTLAKPFEDRMLNFVEIMNEACIYVTLTMILALNTYSF
jgi:hypothetical protein